MAIKRDIDTQMHAHVQLLLNFSRLLWIVILNVDTVRVVHSAHLKCSNPIGQPNADTV